MLDVTAGVVVKTSVTYEYVLQTTFCGQSHTCKSGLNKIPHKKQLELLLLQGSRVKPNGTIISETGLQK